MKRIRFNQTLARYAWTLAAGVSVLSAQACRDHELLGPEVGRTGGDVALTVGQDGTGVARALGWVEASGITGSVQGTYNSTGATNTMQVQGTGLYMIVMPGLYGTNGTVQIDGYRCHPTYWTSLGTNLHIQVECRNDAGIRANAGTFRLLYYKESRTDTNGAYLWADQPSTLSYVPSSLYQWNSAGATNSVVKLGTGRYEAFLPLIHGGSGGTVMVTAYGNGGGHCKVENWWTVSATPSTQPGRKVRVRCYNASNALEDRRFMLSFATDVAFGATSAALGMEGGYLWRNQSGLVGGGPVTAAYSLNTLGGTNAVNASGTGFEAGLPFLKPMNRAITIATSYGANAERCEVGSVQYLVLPPSGPGSGTQANVLCNNPLGASGDYRFVLVHLTDQP